MARQVVITLPPGGQSPDLTQPRLVQMVEEAARTAGITADELVLHHNAHPDKPDEGGKTLTITWTRAC